MIQIDWSDLRLFLLFVRGGTTRAAGQLLGVSHSTVARRLELLSETVGGPLYHRNAGVLELTVAGNELFETAKHIDDEVTGLQRRAFGQSQELQGPVTLSTGDALSVDPFLAILEGFMRKYPKIDLRLITSLSLSDLDRREADLALRFGESPSDHLVGRRLMETGRAVYAAPEYAQKYAKVPGWEGAGWISFSPVDSPENWKKSTPFPHLPTHMRSADMRTQQIACRAGIGLVMLPCFLCDPDPALWRISAPEFVPRQDLWLLRHADMRGNARVRALGEYLVQSLPEIEPLLRGQTAETWRYDP